MNIFKKTEKKIKDWFEQSMTYNHQEVIIFLIIFIFMVLFTIGIGGIFSILWVQVGIIYLFISLALCLKLIDTETKFEEYAIIICLLPYIILLMLIDKVYKKFIPYRGDDPMLLRSYKVRYFKRKARINKLKFWK